MRPVRAREILFSHLVKHSDDEFRLKENQSVALLGLYEKTLGGGTGPLLFRIIDDGIVVDYFEHKPPEARPVEVRWSELAVIRIDYR